MTKSRRFTGLLVPMLCLLGAAPATTQTSFKIVIDTSTVPDLKAYGEKIQTLADEWYPRISTLLPSEGFVIPVDVRITFEEMDGVAETGGDKIRCAAKWFRERPEDRGAVVHELVHVVQHYGGGRGGARNPGWLVEGIADYIRFFHFEPADQRPHPRAGKAKYDDSYRTTAAFLDWAQTKYDKQLVQKLNAACREGKYSPKLWKTFTGKELQDLGDEWQKSLPK